MKQFVMLRHKSCDKYLVSAYLRYWSLMLRS